MILLTMRDYHANSTLYTKYKEKIMKKTSLLIVALLLLSSLLFAQGEGEKQATAAPAYPTKTIKMIVPYGAGGGADISIRLLTKYMEKILGQTIVVQNVAGGSGTIGFSQLADAPADGYTLGYFSSTQSNDSLLFEGIKYTDASFTPIAMYASDPHIIVASKASGIKSMDDLLKAAKAKSGQLTYGLGGAWTSHDFLRLSLESKTGVSFKRMVFQSGAAAVTAVAGNNCDVAVPFVSEALAQIQAGNVVPLAISSEKRFELTPEIPTIKEAGLDFTHTMWRALVGPAGLDATVVRTIDKAVAQVLADPQYQKEVLEAGTFALYMDAASFTKYYAENHQLYKKLIAEAQLAK